MNDISSRITCKNKGNRPLIPLTISAQDGLINQYDYFDKQIASLNLSTYYILKKGQFAYNKSYSNGYPYGAIKRLERYDEGALSSLYICFELKNIDSTFMCKYFDSNKWNYEVKLISGEGARNHGLLNLSPSDFFNIKLYVPTNKIEQLKIAKFIELVQMKIDVTRAKYDTLKKYKKGLLNSLLDGSNTFIQLGDFCDLYQPQTIPQTKFIADGEFNVYGANGIIGKYNEFNHFNSEIIIGCRGNCGSVVFTLPKSWINGNAMVVKINKDIGISKIDLFYELQAINYRKYIEKSGVPQITCQKAKKIRIPRLSSADNKIILIQKIDKKIDILNASLLYIRNIKRYLLNSMFI